MQRSESSPRFSDRRRLNATFFALLLACLAGTLCADRVLSAERSDSDAAALRDGQSEIEATEYCFSSGTDAVGRGQVERAKRIWRRCFTENGVFDAYFPGTDPAGPPDVHVEGIDALADFVDGNVTAGGYIATQHIVTNIQVTNIQIDEHGPTAADVDSYARAVLVIDGSSSIDTAHGFYSDHVVRTREGSWKIAHRTLHLITNMRIESPSALP